MMANTNTYCAAFILSGFISLAVIGCGGSSSSSSDSTDSVDTDYSSNSSNDNDSAEGEVATSSTDNGVNTELFETGALISDITTVSCTLSGGTQTSCYKIEFSGVPADRELGPYCPPSIYSEADEGGIWFDGSGDVWDVDGEFITGLANLYGDSNWLLYDVASGKVNVTDTQTACEAAARPDVAIEYQNHCVECDLDYYGGVVQTALIPTTPVPLASADALTNGNLGVALDGVVLAPPAPVDAILSAYTIAAFDDCGGHVNPHEGYHYHASTGCAQTDFDDDGHAGIMAYALDGYGIYGMLDEDNHEATDLDSCRGHSDATRGYHYHAASAAENMFIGCFSGEQGYIQ